VLREQTAVVSAPTTSIDKVINSSAGSKVRRSVRTLEIIAVATAILTLLYWWNTRPRRRVAIAARKARERDALTQEAREIYASAVAGASVFEAETGQNPVVVNNGNGDHPSHDNVPLAARLPRALSGTPNAADNTSAIEPAVATPIEATADARGRPQTRPNPRPSPRRMRAHSRTRGAIDPNLVDREE
jgi:hypothetical protein